MIDTVRLAWLRITKKTLAWSVWVANLACIVWFWLPLGVPEVVSGDLTTMLHAVGRLCGLLATYCALVQFIVMGRIGWLEPIFGLDRLAIFHRRNGIAAISLILLHAWLMMFTHTQLIGSADIFAILQVPYVWMAMLAETLFIATVGLSIYIVRKHLKFETWYAVHLLNYAAIALVPWHQLTNGGDFLTNPVFAYYWITLYAVTAVSVLYWRFGMTLLKFLSHDFTVERVVHQAPRATSVYIKAKRLEKFKAKAGQFVLVRFLKRPFVWQEHPFSLSRLPNGQTLRLTIRQTGDFTNMIPHLKPGTKVWVSGPFGAFTHNLQRTNKLVYIAGGIGITPIRSMVEDQARRGESGNAILLYGNRTLEETVFWDELTLLGKQIAMPIYNVLSDQKDYSGEHGFIDGEKIKRLVPDVAERDVFLCGPPAMMWGIIAQLKELGVPANQVHYERFSLHKD